MSNYSKLYWLTRLDNIQNVLCGLVSLSIIILAIYYFIMLLECHDNKDREDFNKNNGSIKKTLIWLAIPSAIILTFMPSKSDMLLIYAGGKTMDFVQSDTSINKIPAQTTKIITDYIQKQIDETQKENK